jgi:hypothetical protein
MAHRSRWGWHPCDYETYLLLKRLNARCERALRRFAEWRRWRRKRPHNRLVREPVLDHEGRGVGTRVVGPKAEPVLDPLFCVRRQVRSFRGPDGRPLQEAAWVEDVSFCDLGIPEAYRTARRPVPTEEQVPALRLTPEEVRRLAERAEDLAGERP